MKLSLRTRLEGLVTRLAELDHTLAAPETANDMDRFRALAKEHAELGPVVERFRAWRQAEDDLAAADDLAKDPAMKAFAEDERESARARMDALGRDLEAALLPKDANDARNVFLEVRAGTGGDESALFAGDLLRMYTRYAERQGWKVELVSATASELGGYREAIARIAGDGVYAKLKFESGGHRVQRVPETEAQGRIHTSACTIAVMPEADPVADIVINPADLKVDTFRASGAGGQHVNKTDSAVRITHLPTGLVVECQDQKSQHKNKAKALKVLRARLYDQQRTAQQSAEAAERKSQIGSGDRSERIRTYNYPQNRVTDHRIDLTLYDLDRVMEGRIETMTQALLASDLEERLAEAGLK